ncbi:branched-chain amino acid ABC transporter permease [Agrobacterium vitis]|uniref:branched-chain amino acid ABC transporter permease n=1 Tax=Agrobacterium vitis TaxID=373 RepID=UPI003D2E1D65
MRIGILVLCLAALALFGNDYIVSLIVVIGLEALPALGLALLAGYTGQISLGHAAFYGLGAYGAALLGQALGVPAWLDILLAAILVAVVARVIGWVVFRLNGHYLAMATLAFGIIVQIGLVEWRDVTGGPDGLGNISSLNLIGRMLITDQSYVPVIAVVCISSILLAQNLIMSPRGVVMRAIAGNEKTAAALGNDVQAVKRDVMMLSGFLSALGGGLYAHYIGYLSPGPFDVGFSIRLLLMVAIGGFSNLWGVLFGVVFVTLIGELLKPLGGYDVIAFGALLVISVIFFPKGIHTALNGLPRLLHLSHLKFRKGAVQ